MAVITQRIEVCDVCRDVSLPVTRLRVSLGAGRLRTYALCEDDGAPLREVLSRLGAGGSAGSPPRRSRTLTLEQVEEVKASRAPAKRRRGRPAARTGAVSAP